MPEVTVNNQGVTEIIPSVTAIERQSKLNIEENGNLRPAQAGAAAQIEPIVGTMKPYQGSPTFGDKKPDYTITSGPDAGKTVELMYTTNELSQSQIDGINKFFEKKMTVSQLAGNLPPAIQQIQDHLRKANFVVMDYRQLTSQNQQILTNHIKTLPSVQQAQIKIIK